MKKFSRTTVLVRFYLPIRLFHEACREQEPTL